MSSTITRFFRRPCFTTSVLLLSCGTIASAARPPEWLISAMERETLAPFREAEAVVLRDEAVFDYQRKGRIGVSSRYAVRVQNIEGRDYAQFLLPYDEAGDRIRKLELWIIHPGSKPIRLRRKDCLDRISNANELYSELRTLSYSAASEVRPGTVFSYEYTVDRKSIFAEERFYFGGRIPVLSSRVDIHTPAGWTVRAQANNGLVALSESNVGEFQRWEASNIPALETEEWSALATNRNTQLRFTIEPDSDESRQYPLLSWSTWEALAQYYVGVYEAPSQATPRIAAKAKELTADAAGFAERLVPIARFVQAVNYVAVSIDVSQGGGYTPHAAEETLKAHYGDCKDKSTLMCALLDAVGIEAFPLIVSLDNSRNVDPEWPSPKQFNHCIVAIRIPASVSLDYEAILDHPQLGRLLVFDPTDETTTLGHLGHSLQDERGMVIAPVGEPLIELPQSRPEANRENYRIVASLTPNGHLSGHCELEASGLESNDWRSPFRYRSSSEFQEFLVDQFDDTMRAVQISAAQPDSRDVESRFLLSFDFAAPAYARSMRGRLLIVQPSLLHRRSWLPPDEERTTNLQFRITSRREYIEIAIPEVFVVDEKPKPVAIDKPYLHYRCETHVEAGKLIFERELDWLPEAVPAGEYGELRAIMGSMIEAESAPVVLVREG